jgi:hypothetical protein
MEGGRGAHQGKWRQGTLELEVRRWSQRPMFLVETGEKAERRRCGWRGA